MANFVEKSIDLRLLSRSIITARMYIASLLLSIIASIASIVAHCRLNSVKNRITLVENKTTLIEQKVNRIEMQNISQVYIAGGNLNVVSITEAETNEIHSPSTKPTDTTSL